MGRLMTLKQFSYEDEDPTWWFKDTTYHHSGGYHFDWKAHFAHSLAVHQRFIGDMSHYAAKKEQQELRSDIRKFVDRHCSGNVLRTFTKMDYDYAYKRDPEIAKRSGDYAKIRIQHGFMEFHFEEEQDMLVFRIRFGQFIRPIRDRHFDYPDITDESIEMTKDWRLFGSNLPDWTNE